MGVSQTTLRVVDDDAGKLPSSGGTDRSVLFAKGACFVKSIGKDAHHLWIEDAVFYVRHIAQPRLRNPAPGSASQEQDRSLDLDGFHYLAPHGRVDNDVVIMRHGRISFHAKKDELDGLIVRKPIASTFLHH